MNAALLATRTPTPPVARTFSTAQATHEHLLTWVRHVLGDVSASFEPPGSNLPEGRCISLYLMDLRPAPGAHNNKSSPLQFHAHYLITTWGPVCSAQHEDLFELTFSAIDRDDFVVDFETLPAATWRGFDTPPRPSLRINLHLRRARSQQPLAAMVRTPLVMAPAAMVPLQGRLIGPGDVPVAGARIELSGHGRTTQTDQNGLFVFAGVPAGRTLGVRVQARGLVQEFELQASAETGAPMLLRMSLSR